MAEIHVIKQAGGNLVPASDEDAEILNRKKNGGLYTLTIKGDRDPIRHRRFFAMLNVGFEAFEPPETDFRGLPSQKNFARFRKDVIIAAGHYHVVPALNGEVRLEAKSISFGKMSETEFQALYSKAANVLLQRVLRNYTREDLDEVVEKLIRF